MSNSFGMNLLAFGAGLLTAKLLGENNYTTNNYEKDYNDLCTKYNNYKNKHKINNCCYTDIDKNKECFKEKNIFDFIMENVNDIENSNKIISINKDELDNIFKNAYRDIKNISKNNINHYHTPESYNKNIEQMKNKSQKYDDNIKMNNKINKNIQSKQPIKQKEGIPEGLETLFNQLHELEYKIRNYYAENK